MNHRNQRFLRLLIVLFTVSMSVNMLPCGIVQSHGLFGEVTSSMVIGDDEPDIMDVSSFWVDKHHDKGINIFNKWFYLGILVLCMTWIRYIARLPRGDTIVSFKVRMND